MIVQISFVGYKIQRSTAGYVNREEYFYTDGKKKVVEINECDKKGSKACYQEIFAYPEGMKIKIQGGDTKKLRPLWKFINSTPAAYKTVLRRICP